eukprot:TRINITY_DN27497_c0_g1_i2.p1 TRINITY_DN27497_c0_g1~~TRINITY_DN27497_c0_g1_i2.p1  ORF type:complete len:361 (-),score=50.17 TRINITY_DN27497_c0_g1_i2:191-1273(-)
MPLTKEFLYSVITSSPNEMRALEATSSWRAPPLEWPSFDGCAEVEASLKSGHSQALKQMEDLRRKFHEMVLDTFRNATAEQVSPQTSKWWKYISPASSLAMSTMTWQASLCAHHTGCCSRLALGEALLKWREAQDRLNLLIWLGTFQGALALGPDTVEGRFVEGKAWYAELAERDEEESIGEAMARRGLAEYQSAMTFFERCIDIFAAAVGSFEQAPDDTASGNYASSMVSLYELANIRTVDEGLLRYLSREEFYGSTIAEFGALNGKSSEWLNGTGDIQGALAFDGAKGVSTLTRGRVMEQDLSVPFDLNRTFGWVLSLEVAEHSRGASTCLLGECTTSCIRGCCCILVMVWGRWQWTY